MSGLEIKCSNCQASFDEAEGTCPYCGRTINQIKKEKEEQGKTLSSLQEQIYTCQSDHEAAKTFKEEALPIMERMETKIDRIENKQNTHRQENRSAFERLGGKLDEYQKALLDNMKEILAQGDDIDASVKAYFEKAIALREKEGSDASKKVGGEIIYASPAKHLEEMKEGEAAPFPEFFNCVGFELRNLMETALKRLGVPTFTLDECNRFDLREAEAVLENDENDKQFRFPMRLREDGKERKVQKQAYWNIRHRIISDAKGNGKFHRKPSPGLQGTLDERFLCALGNGKLALDLKGVWRTCNNCVHGVGKYEPLSEEQLSGERAEASRKELLESIHTVNDSGLLGKEKI